MSTKRFPFFCFLCCDLKMISLSELVNFKPCPSRCIPVMGKNTRALVSQAVTSF